MQMHHESKHPKLPFEPEKCAIAARMRLFCGSGGGAHVSETQTRLNRHEGACTFPCSRGAAVPFSHLLTAPIGGCARRRCENLHEVHGGTTQGVAVRGSVKKIHG